MLNVVLYQPQIPPNTGNVARQCVGMNARLHIVKPMCFEITDHAVKRAGLDYWPHLDLTIHDSTEAFLEWLGDRQPWLVTKHGTHRFDQPPYRDEDVLIFGGELKGLPQDFHDQWPNRRVTIPIRGEIRSYNLSNAVAIVLSHANLKAGNLD